MILQYEYWMFAYFRWAENFEFIQSKSNPVLRNYQHLVRNLNLNIFGLDNNLLSLLLLRDIDVHRPLRLIYVIIHFFLESDVGAIKFRRCDNLSSDGTADIPRGLVQARGRERGWADKLHLEHGACTASTRQTPYMERGDEIRVESLVQVSVASQAIHLQLGQQYPMVSIVFTTYISDSTKHRSITYTFTVSSHEGGGLHTWEVMPSHPPEGSTAQPGRRHWRIQAPPCGPTRMIPCAMGNLRGSRSPSRKGGKRKGSAQINMTLFPFSRASPH